MALQFDGNGKVTIPSWQSGSGIWSIRGRAQNTAGRGFIIGSSADSSFSFFTNGTAFEFRYESNNVIHSAVLTPGEYYDYEFGFDGLNRYIEVDGVREIFTTHTEILVDFDSIGAYTFSASKFAGVMVGQVVFTGGSQNRSYDLVNSTGSTLTETVNGQDGALTGFTTGGFFSLTVNAGPDETATNGDTVTLAATASNYDSLLWECTSGQSPTFSDATALNPTVTFNEAGLHTLQLTATNAEGSTSDSVTYTVEAATLTGHVIGGFKTLNIPEAGNSGWRNPVAVGAVALFDANSLTEDLALQSNGIVSFIGGTRPREQVASTGEYGWRFRMPAGESPDSNGLGAEKEYLISRPQTHCWEEMRVWQPSNYYNRYIVAAFSTEPLSVTSDWLEGDTVTTSTGTATYVSSLDQAGEAKHFFKDLSDGDTVVFVDGETVTNDRTGGSFTIDRALFIATNKKLFSMWIDDGIHKQPRGYSQSGMFFEITANYNDGGSVYPKFNYLESFASGEGSSSVIPNDINPVNPYVFDTADNGHWVTLIVERKRSETASSGGAIARMWKKTERSGSDTENWTLIYETTDGQQFHSEEYNGFNRGYIFGATNGGYTEETDFYLNKYALYESKPQQLIDAGV